jgi:ankyrin repeat protein
MKIIFALSLLLASPLQAMIRYPSQQHPAGKQSDLNAHEIDPYLKMVSDAAANGHLSQLKLLQKLAEAQFEVFLDRSNALGATPLYYACQNGHTEVVRYLLEENAIPSQELSIGAADQQNTPCTPLHIAAAQGHLEIVKLLVTARDATKNTRHAPKSRTPLHYAIAHGHTEIAIFLLTQKASYVSPDSDLNTPLSLAAKCEYDPALVEAFSKGNVLTAAANGWGELISEFIAIKANLEETDPVQKATPLIWAASEGHPLIVMLLLDANANIHAKNKDGLTALDCAKKNHNWVSVGILDRSLKMAQAGDDKGKDEAKN